MSDTLESVRRKISSAGDLHAVVRTMKTLAGANIGQYEQSVHALADYYRTVELGLSIGLAHPGLPFFDPLPQQQPNPRQNHATVCHVVVFGSDQGLVGQFNDAIARFALAALPSLPGKVQLWAVGSRVHARLGESALPLMAPFNVPLSVNAITPLVGQILLHTATPQTLDNASELHLFYNSPSESEIYQPVCQQLLPLDTHWLNKLRAHAWPTKNLPELLGDPRTTLQALIREYLFVSLFRAAAESLASENASRLAAMQRADKNIQALLANLHATFHRMRQNSIDEELFDVITGFEALVKPR
ncbi:F0F1 ATP synthase subunit gamma [Flavobacterium sp. W21_SRS_FM6]|uniref:F0F1 ATP synthase subunit gamma n=1 Tax=Flavobacterium sp. W21_SRS_FM6 TaxID=3240268 RepID=UPI003F8E2AD6